MHKKQREPEAAAIFPALCAVIAIVLFSSMPIYRGLESSFSEERGLGAAMVMLREEIEQNESVATFLGLSPVEEAIFVSAAPADDEVHAFDLDAEVAAYIAAHTPDFVLPLDGDLNSPFGTRVDPFADAGMRLLGMAATETHRGIDISAARSRDVRAAMDGVVRFVGWDNSYGNYLIITHDACETLYAHCDSIAVEAGQTVRAGESIAVAGATGRATGIHLHFEVFVDGVSVDPTAYFGIYDGEASAT